VVSPVGLEEVVVVSVGLEEVVLVGVVSLAVIGVLSALAITGCKP
jgi:hypothetical protein